MSSFEEKPIPANGPLTCDCGRPVEHFASSHIACSRLEERLCKQRDELLADTRELLKGEPCTDDDDVSMPEDTWLCLTHQHLGNTKQPCLIRRLRKKWGAT